MTDLAGPRFEVGDRVVRANAPHGLRGTVRPGAYYYHLVHWDNGRSLLHRADELEPAERWMTDAERDGV